MKLLVFAHTPPPHHGQSYMVETMLKGFGGDARRCREPEANSVQCYHVNCRVSDTMSDIGSMQFGKLTRLLRFCLEAIWCRVWYGAQTFYYVPAPGKRSALYRDWMVMTLCRPFFSRIVLHWHAAGLGEWLEREGNRMEQAITRFLLGRPSLSIVLSEFGSKDAQWIRSEKIAIVPNGIVDPCPEFASELLCQRTSRTMERARRLRAPESEDAPLEWRVLFLAHCTREKGLFDTLEGVALFNRRQTRLRIHLTVAGAFITKDEEREFQERIGQPDLAGAVTYAGFVSGDRKRALLEENDCLSFPTYYSAESFGLNIVEALAYGIPTVATRWRALPEILPANYPGFVETRAPLQISDALERLAGLDLGKDLRAHFLANFTIERHILKLQRTILETNPIDPTQSCR